MRLAFSMTALAWAAVRVAAGQRSRNIGPTRFRAVLAAEVVHRPDEAFASLVPTFVTVLGSNSFNCHVILLPDDRIQGCFHRNRPRSRLSPGPQWRKRH